MHMKTVTDKYDVSDWRTVRELSALVYRLYLKINAMPAVNFASF